MLRTKGYGYIWSVGSYYYRDRKDIAKDKNNNERKGKNYANHSRLYIFVLDLFINANVKWGYLYGKSGNGTVVRNKTFSYCTGKDVADSE